MKLLFLLVFAPFCLAHCPANHFKDDVFNQCLKCTPCHITLTPCTAKKDAVCEYFNDKNNHHFLKNRIHFLDDMVDDSLDEEFHEGDFLFHQRDQHKKNGKHLKSKHEEKHHHKKKHYEFDDDNDDESSDNYNDDFDFKFEKIEKPKKHKKHFEFTKQKGNVKHYNKKMDDLLSDKDLEDEEDFIFGKDFKKNKKQASHPKKIDVNEEELEELLLQSQKKLKIQKDKFLKTLKDEKETSDKHNKFKGSKNKKNSQSDALKALADLNSNDDMDDDDDDDYEDDLDSLLDKSEESYKPGTPQVKINEKLSSQVIGQGEAVNEMIKSEMGKNVIYEKPHFKIIPYVIGKDFDTQGKKSYSQKYHSPSQKKHTTFNKDNDSEEYREIESNEVVSLPFTAAETLVWDWQAVAVASAVASCLVFFLVVAIYFIVNTRHWKKVNKHYNKELISELDDISTRIALMQPMLELGSPNSRTSIYMENTVSPIKEDEKKGDMKV